MIPVPGNSFIEAASHTNRSACDGLSSAWSCSPLRASGPRTGEKSAPSWVVRSSTTRSLAVAVQHNTGTPGPSRSNTRTRRL